MKKFIKNNIKVIIAFILGLIISSGGVYAATIIFASDEVGYDNTNTNLQINNVAVDNVQDAIDAIYTKVTGIQTQLVTAQSNMVTYRDEICPGCVYRKSTTTKSNSKASWANGTNNVLSSSEYTTDYTTLNSNYFLGHVIDSNGYILSSYACGINNGTFFCLRGVDSSQTSLTYKPFYQEGVNMMNKAFPGCNANTSGLNVRCSGGVNAYVSDVGEVYVYVGEGVGCDVSYYGTSYCS